ncbi:MAG: NAD(P)-binding domain-containing protein, partial [Flammeovirgaceae bacterium]
NFNKEINNNELSSLNDSLASSDCVITMLPNSKTVFSNWNLCFNHARKGTILIDCSTISPVDAKDFSAKATEKGFIASDSPVSGGVNGAINATLTFMVGAEQKNYELVKS